ncbi:MAG TPA: hypoxanthine phosphoribosyltransferase [Acidobacteriaceae bacterium]
MATSAHRVLSSVSLPILITREEIAKRIVEIGAQIDRDFARESVLLVGVLKGAAIFLSDLARAVTIPCTFDFVAVSSYGKAARSSGAVKLIKDLDHPIEDRNIILVEDILDTGLTLSFLKRMLMQHRPRTLRVATLLDKPDRRLEAMQAEYVGFTIPNHFVIGYGMDYAERYRNLPDVCIFPPEAAD